MRNIIARLLSIHPAKSCFSDRLLVPVLRGTSPAQPQRRVVCICHPCCGYRVPIDISWAVRPESPASYAGRTMPLVPLLELAHVGLALKKLRPLQFAHSLKKLRPLQFAHSLKKLRPLQFALFGGVPLF